MERDLAEVDNFIEKIPKVGEHYQVEIPALMSNSDYDLCQKGLQDAKGASTIHESQGKSSIPAAILISDDEKEDQNDQMKHTGKSIGVINKSKLSNLKCVRERQNSPRPYTLNPQMEAIDNTLVNVMNIGEGVQNECQGRYLFSGSSSVSWNEMEVDAFTLGLHVFGKNFVLVKKFIGNKEMKDILEFYYGEFYNSKNHRSWDRFMQTKGKRCMACRNRKGKRKCEGCRRKSFTIPRKQEFLSRLQLYVPMQSHSTWFEAHKTFLGNKLSLEEYVFILKDLVGLKSLVKAFGFGNESDLTLISKDSLKSTHEAPIHPKSLASKDYSTLTAAEVIRLLTSDLRRSKTQSSVLFWEAVWPRLLAKGWRSEQLGRSNIYSLSYKAPLLFMVPGVEKFSRYLVKGTHYFDSVSDVLSQVASKPQLIELKTVADNEFTNKEGYGCIEEKNMGCEYSFDHQSQFHLQPKTLDVGADVMMFNIVDTSMGGQKLGELRSLPNGGLKDSTSEYYSMSVINKEGIPVAHSSGSKGEPQLNIKTGLDLNSIQEVESEEPSMAERQSIGTGMKLKDHRVDPMPALDMKNMTKTTRPAQQTIKVLEDLASEISKAKTKRKGIRYLQDKLGI